MIKLCGKNKNGISLIVLIITIIVVIIISAAVIIAINGNNGILNNAKSTVENQKIEALQEDLNLILQEFEIVSQTSAEYSHDLQGIYNFLCSKEEVSYVRTKNSVGNKSQLDVTAYNSIYVKLKKYEYEFKINKQLEIEEVINIETKNVIIVKNSGILLSYSSEGWTNNSVSVVAKNLNGNDSELQFSIDGINWIDGNTCIRETNGKVMFRLKNSNYFVQTTVSNIDKEAPTGKVELSQYVVSNVVMGASIKVVDIFDGNNEINYNNSKYVLNQTAEAIGIDSAYYTDGNLGNAKIEGTTCSVDRVKSAGTYYLHVLLVDNLGNAREVISANSITVVGKKEFNYTGTMQEINLPKGNYKIECWGAQGGSAEAQGGNGAYTSGNIQLVQSTKLNIVIGSTTSNYNGGYNGGGNGAYDHNSTYSRGGGGATDVRVVSGELYNFNSLASRIMVAAGGGGASWSSDNVPHTGSAAGILTGYGDYYGNGYFPGGSGGTQTSGGYASGYTAQTSGSFGKGGTGYVYNGDNNQHTSGGGGGGYYGGGRR